MLDEQQLPAGLEHPAHLSERLGHPRYGAKGPGGDDGVDGLVFQRDRLGRALDERHWQK